MRIQYLSDLHFEFHADRGASFVDSLDPSGVDVLVIAGDLAVGDGVGPALDRLCARYARSAVVYVHGNHEFYGTTRGDVVSITRAACERHGNLHWLDADVTEIGGVRFVGTPLWFRHPGPAEPMKMEMNDFHQIHGFEGWVYSENARAIDFLEREIREGDVVVTHYLPTAVCIAPEYAASPLNPFFLCDVEALLRARCPVLWVHGHTHSSVDVAVGATRVVCNPFGYARREENSSFRVRAVVAIGP